MSTTQNFLSQSPIRSPRKKKKITQMLKSSVNLRRFEHSRPSIFSISKLSKLSSHSRHNYPRYQWSIKRDEILIKEVSSIKTNFIHQLQNASYGNIVILFQKNRIYIKTINVIVFIIDFVVCFLLIVSYNLFINNNMELNKKINTFRLFSGFLSIINCFLVVIRLFVLKKIRLIKYVLNIRLTYPPRHLNYFKIFTEIFIHLLFPYPYFSFKMMKKLNDCNIIYSSDMFLFILGFFRLYTCSRLFLLTLDFRSIRVWKLFNNKKIFIFKFRYLIQTHPILTNIILIVLFLFIATFFFQIFENIEQNQKLNFYNTFWLLSQTILNCGFGDYQIKTPTGRIFIFIIFFFGLHLSISLILSILNLLDYQTEKEIKAYQQIKLVYNKNQKNTFYSIYFEHYLKYKLIKIKDSLKTHQKIDNSNVLKKINISLALKVPLYHDKDNMIFKILSLKNHLKIIKDKYYLNVLAKLKVDPTFNDFFNYVKNNFDVRMKECILKTEKNIESIINLHTFFCDNITGYYHNVLETYYQSNRITNLMLLIFWTGGRFNIKDFDDLVKYKVIALKEFDLKYREFRLIFSKNKKRKIVMGNDMKLTKVSKESDLISGYGYDNFMDEGYDSEFDYYEDFEFEEEDEMNEVNHNYIDKNSSEGQFKNNSNN